MVGIRARPLGASSPQPPLEPVFQPYGICENIPDPIARTLNSLLDEVTNLRGRLTEIESNRLRTDPDSIAGVEASKPHLGNGAIGNERVS
jgi:hypothetical protein